MASVPPDVFETVISGFASVSLSPVVKMRSEARTKALHELGITGIDTSGNPSITSNQTIISGTAYYTFNHFYDYFRKYKAIIESKGDVNKLEEIFRGEIPPQFNWKDYALMRVPVDMLPSGFMDEKTIARAKATIHAGIFGMEYGAVFCGDSSGFYKRSLIEKCVVGKPDNPITTPEGEGIVFTAALRGNLNSSYVMAIDPASEQDNFSIVILELFPNHRRVVYCWTITRARYKAKLKKGLAKEQDFYRYCAAKIRELMKLFYCERIALDSQGGGIAVMEALGDPAGLEGNERPIYTVVDEEKPSDTDNKVGDHILVMINFARAEWVSEANHGMRKDFEDKTLLFPEFNPAIVGLAIEEDKMLGRVKVDSEGTERLYDTLEDCVMEIEELKDELATIVHTQTGVSLRDRWDTPEVKQAGGRKGRLRKDRYSALLMANMVARIFQKAPQSTNYEVYGGFAQDLVKRGKVNTRGRHNNPEWYDRMVNSPGYGIVAGRGNR
jgi:hypothetical protein